jgi:Ca2+-binding RTX toxin-like protein
MARYLENLENRTLFAAAPLVAVATLSADGTRLDVVGSKKGDDIHVSLNADAAHVDVTANGTLLGSYPLDVLALIAVDGGKGNDNIHVDSNVLVATNLSGNVGNDILVAGGGTSTMSGGAGKDSLTGSPVGDLMEGGNGGDVLAGGDGDDHINGGNGADVIDGGNGNDIIVGGTGRDALTGGAGADNFAGNDKVWELRDLNGVEDTYTLNLNPLGIIDDFFGSLF